MPNKEKNIHTHKHNNNNASIVPHHPKNPLFLAVFYSYRKIYNKNIKKKTII